MCAVDGREPIDPRYLQAEALAREVATKYARRFPHEPQHVGQWLAQDDFERRIRELVVQGVDVPDGATLEF